MDARLAEIAAELDDARLAAELFDADWRLVWVSDELKTLLDERDGPFGDYGQAPPERRPDPRNVIEP